MIKKGMNLTKDQRGEVPQEAEIDSISAAVNSQMKRSLLERMMTSIKVSGMM
jgi:transcription initiation factor TFIIE subunit alpha